jgi:hypothetical protein
MLWVGFQLKIPVFQRTKTFDAFDRSASAIGSLYRQYKGEMNSIEREASQHTLYRIKYYEYDQIKEKAR